MTTATWYVVVVIQPPDVIRPPMSGYALGPSTWSDARALALRWERDHGAGTTEVIDRLPTGARLVSHAGSKPVRIGPRVRPLWSQVR